MRKSSFKTQKAKQVHVDRAAVQDLTGDSGPYYSPQYIHSLLYRAHKSGNLPYDKLKAARVTEKMMANAMDDSIYTLDRWTGEQQFALLTALASLGENEAPFLARLQQYNDETARKLLNLRSIKNFSWRKVDAVSDPDRDGSRALYVDICITEFLVRGSTL